MNRSSGLFLLTGPFFLTRIGPFYPTLGWPFSPNPNRKERYRTDLVYSIDGVRGRRIRIYPYKCVIHTHVTIGSVLTGNATDGEKTIYFKDVIGIQYKKPGAFIGYLQFETAAMTMNNVDSNYFNENTFTFDQKTEKIVHEAYEYVVGIMDLIKTHLEQDACERTVDQADPVSTYKGEKRSDRTADFTKTKIKVYKSNVMDHFIPVEIECKNINGKTIALEIAKAGNDYSVGNILADQCH